MLENWIPWIMHCAIMRIVWSDRTDNGIITLFVISLVISSPSAEGRKRREHRYPSPIPRFLPTESNYTYHTGDLAILYCSVKNLGTKTLVWRRVNESYPLTVGSLVYTDDKRFEVSHIKESQDWNLMISNVSTADSGPYECQIAAIDRDLRKEIFLHVKDERSYATPHERSYATPHISVTGAMHVDRGNRLQLVCNATGEKTPPESIDWFKDGKKIHGENGFTELRKKLSVHSRTISSTLTKLKTVMSDKGTYTCRTSGLQVTSVKVIVLNTEKHPIKRGNENIAEKGDMVMENTASSSLHTSLPFVLHCLYIFIFIHELFRLESFLTNYSRGSSFT